MKRVGLLGVLLAVVLCGEAQAVTLVTPDGRPAQPYQRWSDASQVSTPRARLALVRSIEPCHEHYGCTDERTVWIDPADQGPHVLYHELGHVFDHVVMDDSDRSTYLSLRSLRAPFFGSGPDNPDEDFAERYAECAEGIGNAAGTGWICGFIRNVAAGHPGAVDFTPSRRVRHLRGHRRRG